MRRKGQIQAATLFLALLTGFAAMAQSAPPLISYQGRITDDAGVALSGGTVQMRFVMRDGDTSSASALWSETVTSVPLQNGIYSVILGGVNPINPSVLTGTTVYLEVSVEGEVLLPRRRVTSVPFALNAAALGGVEAGELYTRTEVDALLAAMQSQIDALSARVTDNEDAIQDNEADILANAGDITANSDAVAALDARIDANEEKLSPVTVSLSGQTVIDVYYTGVNFHVRSGSGTTNGAVNGRGNLIVGYNENSYGYSRTGSHNVVVGTGHGYSSYGGLVAGLGNGIYGAYSSVTGGTSNQANAQLSSVSGGSGNQANASGSSVSGGYSNQVTSTAPFASISGGVYNFARGDYATVTGGYSNEADGDYSTVSGGYDDSVSGSYDWRAGTTYFADD